MGYKKQLKADLTLEKRDIVKRYQNRKLYSVRDSSYLTLDDLIDRLKKGETFQVIDNKTRQDITNKVKMQALFYRESKTSEPKVLTPERVQEFLKQV